MAIKRHRRVILGVDDDRPGCDVGSPQLRHRIDHEHAAEPLAALRPIHRKPADARHGNAGIARQLFCERRRNRVQRKFRRRQRITAGDRGAVGTAGDKAFCDEPPRILRRLFAQIAVSGSTP